MRPQCYLPGPSRSCLQDDHGGAEVRETSSTIYHVAYSRYVLYERFGGVVETEWRTARGFERQKPTGRILDDLIIIVIVFYTQTKY